MLSLVMGATGLVALATPAFAFPALVLPFQPGTTFYVCQGYNGGPSHGGDPALDLTTHSGRGPNGCYGGAAAGQPILAPAAGQAANLNNGLGGVCLTYDDGTSMYFGHLSHRANGRVAQGQQLGTIASAGAEGNNGYAHLHLSARSGRGCGGSKVPFSGAARFQEAPDLTYSGAANQWAGTALVRSTGHSPQGTLDEASSPAPGHVHVRGWAFDRDAPTAPLAIHVYVGGPAGAGDGSAHTADAHRPDVGAAYPGVGDVHGYDLDIPTNRSGAVPVYVYAINAGAGGQNVLLGSTTVNVADPTPVGSFDGADSPSPGRVRVGGWAIDPNRLTAPVVVHVYIGGPTGSGAPGFAITADRARPDVAAAVPGAGEAHGFSKVFRTPLTGRIPVFAYALNIDGTPGNHRLLGERVVDVVADTVAPDTTITAGPSGSATGSSVTFELAADDEPVTFACQLDQGPWQPCSSPVTLSVQPGTHMFAARATDEVGNTDPTPASRTFTVAPPSVPRFTVSATAVANNSQLLVDIGPDGQPSRVVARIETRDGRGWTSARQLRLAGPRHTAQVNLPRGTYRVVVPTQLGLSAAVSRTVTLHR